MILAKQIFFHVNYGQKNKTISLIIDCQLKTIHISLLRSMRFLKNLKNSSKLDQAEILSFISYKMTLD